MRPPATAPAGLALLVSVVSGERRLDLRLPAALPVAELVPEVLRAAGLLEPRAGPAHRLLRIGGEALLPTSGLAAQGIEDGALLVLAPDEGPWPPPHDDLAGLVAEVVEHDLPHRDADTARRLSASTGVVLLGLTAVPLLTLGSLMTGAVAATAALVLLGLPRLLTPRLPGQLTTALAWLAVGQSATAGVLLGSSTVPVPVAVGAGVVVGGLLAVALAGPGRRHRVLAAPVAGGMLVLAGVVLVATDLGAGSVLTVTLVAVVLAGDALPWLASAAVGLHPSPIGGEAASAGHDRGRVAARVRAAHRLLGALAMATGLVVAILAPVAVAQGPWGAALALACSALLVLRCRRHRVAATGLTVALAGLAGLLSTALAALWWHPAWHPYVLAALLTGGVLSLAGPALPVAGSPRAGRAAEVAESLLLVSVPPLLLLATATLDLVRGWVG